MRNSSPKELPGIPSIILAVYFVTRVVSRNAFPDLLAMTGLRSPETVSRHLFATPPPRRQGFRTVRTHPIVSHIVMAVHRIGGEVWSAGSLRSPGRGRGMGG